MPSSSCVSASRLATAAFLPKSKTAVIDLWSTLGSQDAVCFDVDSTVIVDEFIDELAEYCGVGERVQQVTRNAMGGKTNFRTALKERLCIIRPTLDQLEKFKNEKPIKFTPGIRKLVDTLHARKVSVYLVSGGFQSLIVPVAQTLNIPDENIMANKLLFDEQGNYVGFDETEPTSVSGGKALAVSAIKERAGHHHVVMIGDGATDAEACPPANAFIGFGGNVSRDNVKQKCFYYVHSFGELTDHLLANNPSSCSQESMKELANNAFHSRARQTSP